MTDEMYKRLNDYLNDIFIKLNKKDQIFVDNLSNFAFLNTNIVKFFKDTHRVNSISKKNNLTFNDVYLLAREIIEKINPEYLSDFDKLLDSGELNFDYDNEIDGGIMSYDETNGQLIKNIDIGRSFNYTDVKILVHEFFHYLNLNDILSFNRVFFTEFISIYFELKAQNYLLEEKKIPNDEIDINDRIIMFLNDNYILFDYIYILMAYENLGDINRNTPNDLKEVLYSSDDLFESECIRFLKYCDKINQKYDREEAVNKMTKQFNQHYKYIIGTLLAYYADKHCKIEDMIKLNDNINSIEYASLSMEEVLNTVGIKINDKTINEALEIIKSSIYEFNLEDENDFSNNRSNRRR